MATASAPSPQPDEATALFALFDSFIAASRHFAGVLMLHDRPDGLLFYALRLWCSANRIEAIERVATDDAEEWTVIDANIGGPNSYITIFSGRRPLTREPVPGVVIELPVIPQEPTPEPSPTDDSATRFSLLELDR